MTTLVQAAQGSTNGGTLTVSFGSNIGAGHSVVVCVTGLNATSATGLTVAPASGADTYAQEVSESSDSQASIWAILSSAGGYTTVDITNSTHPHGLAAWIYEVDTLTALDKTSTGFNSGGFNSSWSSGATATTTQANEFWVGVSLGEFTNSQTTTGPSSPWTNETSQTPQDVGVWFFPSVSGYQIVTSTGAATYNGTFSVGANAWSACVATFKAVGTHSGASTLSGSGTLTATGAFAGSSTLSGSGTLTSNWVYSAEHVVLSGTGTLSGAAVGTLSETATLSGTGTLTATGAAALFQSAALSGTGSLSVSGVKLGFQIALSGTGTLGVIGLGGHVSASAGGATPYAHPGTSQVSVAPPGSSNWQYLGSIGLVSALQYSFVCPGGADKLSITIQVPADYRNQLLNPGWQIRVTRGGHVVWTGRTDEPSVSASGWTMTAVGDGNRGADFLAIFTDTWPTGEPDEAVNNAIARGLPWVNPGIGSPSGIWLGQGSDSGSQTITALLNLICTRGGLTWYANSQPGGFPGTDLAVFPLPTVVNRNLVCTDPVSRTLGGDINTIFLKYEVAAASSSTSGNQQATYATTSVQNAASVAMHGVMETYVDLSSAGVMSAGAAQAVGNNVLAIYQRASFAGPFTAAYGQLTNTGGAPIDPGTDQAGTVCRLILTDYGYGGEVTPAPITFIVGSYSWDDFAQKATITPFQTLDQSLTGLLSMESTVLQPITTVP